jgi:hypothetical protein
MNPLTIVPDRNPQNGEQKIARPELLTQHAAPAFLRGGIVFESKSTRRMKYAPGTPNYEGRMLCLNPEHPRRSFQCYGFILGGPKNQSGLVSGQADMAALQRAIQEGCLLDITDSGEIKTENSTLSGLEESVTDKKVYFMRRDTGETVVYGTADKAKQDELDAAIAARGVLDLPPGFGEEDKYLIRPPEPEIDFEYARQLLAESKMPWYRRMYLHIKRQFTGRRTTQK